MKKTNKKGFTIVELVIVIAVIAILAAVLIPTFSNIIDKANHSAALQKATASYKEAYAIAISDDGKVTVDDFNHDEDADQEGIESNGITWTYEAASGNTPDKWTSSIFDTSYVAVVNGGVLTVTP